MYIHTYITCIYMTVKISTKYVKSKDLQEIKICFTVHLFTKDRLCGLVVRVPVRSRTQATEFFLFLLKIILRKPLI
jgi:hypothetical protein